MEITPGVYLVDKVRGSNVYLLADRCLALIDTGMPGNETYIIEFIRKLGRNPKELTHIIVTHGHVDHTGSAAELQRLTGAKIVAHKNEIVTIKYGDFALAPHPDEVKGFIRKAMSRQGIFKRCPADIAVKDGQVLPYLGGLRVIHTPGHTRGSMCLLLEKPGVLFVGDAIINNQDRLSRPLPLGADKSISEMSLKKMTESDFNICCFGHGPPLEHRAQEIVTDFANSYPGTPLWQRVLKNTNTLIRFACRLLRR